VAGVNPIRQALTSGEFRYVVELVASAKSTEEQILGIASDLAQIPEVMGAGITSYAGGSAGHDPVPIAAGAKSRGLTPNVHITCVNKDRRQILRELEEIQSHGMENVFAITGDYPLGADKSGPSPFDIDSVQLVEFINELRQAGYPFYISVAVSPFKYTEADCAYQYLKLEKKIAAGADFAITQLGYDAKKLRELKRYLDERNLKTPVLGNVYVLTARAAAKMSKGEPPGCWVSQELLERIQEETNNSTDKGLAARLERAARMAAIVRGLGYAGVYLGGTHKSDHIRWIIQRAAELAPQWEELAEELNYGPQGGFYYYETPRAEASLGFLPRLISTATELFPAYKPGLLRSILTGVFRTVDRSETASRVLERFELAVKEPMFGCKSCGNCVLSHMEYVCPMTCPKNMRNGPCGGTFNGQCEVIPEQKCIWVAVYDRAKAAGKVDELKNFIPARDRALQDTSSWINYFLNRDSRPGNEQPLIQIQPSAARTTAASEPAVKN
jgi:methylenetetrahydrofolate reductase (NADH)